MIVVEGIIGVGKSTFCQDLAKHLEGSVVFLEPTDHPYLSLFYRDIPRWALEMQFYLMARRFKQHEDAIRLEWSQGIQTIHDRSIWGDKAFADMLSKDGFISDLGYKTYLMHRECMLGFLLVPQVVIWLEASPEICVKRINTRGRGCESGITVQYLKALRETYNSILDELEKKGALILSYDWNEIQPTEKIIDDILKQKKVSRLLHFHEHYREVPIHFSRES